MSQLTPDGDRPDTALPPAADRPGTHPPGADLPDVNSFRQAMGRFATGVVMLTTRTRDVDQAMTASALTSVSLEPLLLLVCIEREGRFHDAVLEAGFWGVSVLSSRDRPGADWLATRDPGFATREKLRVAVDQEMADWKTDVRTAREIAFFPPVTGG